MTYTVDQVHALRFKAKAELEALGKRHAEEREIHEKRIAAADAWLLNYLNESGLESAKTEHGVSYKSTVTSVTVAGFEQLLDFIVLPGIERMAAALEAGGSEADAALAFRTGPEISFLNRAVNKTAVLEHLEQKQSLPPGVKMTSVVQVNTRRA